MSEIIERIRRLFPFRYSVVAQGNDDALPLWLAELPFQVREFRSGTEINGWLAGDKWSVAVAEIRKDGKLVYDGTKSPLGVITNSGDFSGSVDRETLREHLFYSDEYPQAIVYHWTLLYRPNERTWGFCVPKNLYDSLAPGIYDVSIKTNTSPGTLKVLDYRLAGASHATILLNGHNCHPFQANDDLSGCAVGIEVMRRLARLPQRRFSYRLVVAPELIGTALWLEAITNEAKDLICGIMLKSVGNADPLKLQESFTGQAPIDHAAHHVFRHRFGDYISGPFRTIYGNDETVFEAPGYEIPTISLTRFPFRGYHTDRDTVESLSPAALDEAVDVTFDICLALERNIRLERRFKGLVCLSHPRYRLYRPAPAPGIDHRPYSQEMAAWNRLMNELPRYLDGQTRLLALAERYGLPIDQIHDYVQQWVERGLARVIPDSGDALDR